MTKKKKVLSLSTSGVRDVVHIGGGGEDYPPSSDTNVMMHAPPPLAHSIATGGESNDPAAPLSLLMQALGGNLGGGEGLMSQLSPWQEWDADAMVAGGADAPGSGEGGGVRVLLGSGSRWSSEPPLPAADGAGASDDDDDGEGGGGSEASLDAAAEQALLDQITM
jgi:hypothetical protein